jgi:hypothetical protein
MPCGNLFHSPLFKTIIMANYSDLQLNSFYLILEEEDDFITLVQPLMETDNCVLLLQHDDEDITFWKRKDDTFFEIVDELTEEQAAEYEDLFEEEDDTFEVE